MVMKTRALVFCVTMTYICMTSPAVVTADRGSWPTAPTGCAHGGRVVAPGARFKPDPCTRCRCPRKGGSVVCTAEDCRHDVHCLRHANLTASSRSRGSCCAQCVEHGCRHTDGVLYRPGDVISRDSCTRCLCPPKGGPPTCHVTSCPPALCVDFALPPGQCCPVCPRGHNCQLGLRIIPRGRVVTSGGSLCRCRLIRRGGNRKLEAMCLDPKSAKVAELLKTLKGRKKKQNKADIE